LDHLVSHCWLGRFARPARLFALQLALALKFEPLRLALLPDGFLVSCCPLPGGFLIGNCLLAGSFSGNFLRIGLGLRRRRGGSRLVPLGLQNLFGAVAVEERVIFGADHIGLDKDGALLQP